MTSANAPPSQARRALLTDEVRNLGPTNDRGFDWSRDGKCLSFTRDTDGQSNLWFADVETGEQEPMTLNLDVTGPLWQWLGISSE
ncbi:MAG: hypothetical protein ACYTF8_12365 [Planctomycetota bacterium]